VDLVVADGRGNDTLYGVKIWDVGEYRRSRLERIVVGVTAVYRCAAKLDADIYHFHDPELIIPGLFLRLKGKKVIFDVHENIPEQIRAKQWVPCRKLIAGLYPVVNFICRRFFYLILAESSYEKIYGKLSRKYVIVQNMPDIKKLAPFYHNDRSENGVFYIGRVSENRGIFVVLEALKVLGQKNIDFRFHCVGEIDRLIYERLVKEVAATGLKPHVTFYGRLTLEEGYRYSSVCAVGLSILKPIANFTESYSTKIFEYMAVGLPVITSDFPLYKGVVEKQGCGICVNPLDPTEIANAIQWLLEHPSEAEAMGKSGIAAVKQYYNWENEGRKLLSLYEKLLQ